MAPILFICFSCENLFLDQPKNFFKVLTSFFFQLPFKKILTRHHSPFVLFLPFFSIFFFLFFFSFFLFLDYVPITSTHVQIIQLPLSFSSLSLLSSSFSLFLLFFSSLFLLFPLFFFFFFLYFHFHPSFPFFSLLLLPSSFFPLSQIQNLKGVVDFSLTDSITGMSGLHYACIHGHCGVLELLLKEGGWWWMVVGGG